MRWSGTLVGSSESRRTVAAVHGRYMECLGPDAATIDRLADGDESPHGFCITRYRIDRMRGFPQT